MNNNIKKWLLLATLSIIWGSSFILIKKGLLELTPIHLGSLRIIFTTLVILSFSFKSLLKIKKRKMEMDNYYRLCWNIFSSLSCWIW